MTRRFNAWAWWVKLGVSSPPHTSCPGCMCSSTCSTDRRRVLSGVYTHPSGCCAGRGRMTQWASPMPSRSGPSASSSPSPKVCTLWPSSRSSPANMLCRRSPPMTQMCVRSMFLPMLLSGAVCLPAPPSSQCIPLLPGGDIWKKYGRNDCNLCQDSL